MTFRHTGGSFGHRGSATIASIADAEPIAEQERRFYDEHYAAYLRLPDHALIVNRQVMLAQLSDPRATIYERRRLYQGVLERLLAEPMAGRRVLDYGCGPGDWGVLLATEGALVTLLDLSPVAVELGLRRARASGVADRVRGVARDASDLGCFADGEFDLVFASASLHHTLKYRAAFAELVRVIQPGGKLLLAETYGNNPVLNLARRLRARLAREPAEQGEGIVLSERELELLRRHFRRVDLFPMNLLAMAKRLFRGRFHLRAVRLLLGALERTDSVLLRLWPALARYCGEVIVVAVK